MFDENKFKEEYKCAYDAIAWDGDKVKQLKDVSIMHRKVSGNCSFHTAAAIVVICCLMFVVSTPAMAGVRNLAFDKIVSLAPGLAEYILPVKLTDTKEGITMQVEAMRVEGDTAEVVVSFSDAESSNEDMINGAVDMYDSYRLTSYGGISNVGGCSYLGYDEETGKAYFQTMLMSENEFDKARLKFTVRQLLTEHRTWTEKLDVSNIIYQPAMKECIVSGHGGIEEEHSQLGELFYKTEESFPRYAVKVMNITALNADMKSTLQILGIGYSEGILRVQICRGNLEEADRHANLYIMDTAEEYKYSDCSVSWHEEVNGERLMLEEWWFLLSEEELDELEMYGEFFITDGAVNGNWQVTVSLEEKISK